MLKKGEVMGCVEISSKFPYAHGALIHIEEPSWISITNLKKPDYK